MTGSRDWSGRVAAMVVVALIGFGATAARAETVRVALGDVVSVETLAFIVGCSENHRARK